MNENNTPEYMPPVKAYTKRDLGYLLRDPQVNLDAPGAAKPFCRQKLKRMIIGEGLLSDFGITESEYDQIRIFTTKQSELILRRLL
jgi:hypothetical protein